MNKRAPIAIALMMLSAAAAAQQVEEKVTQIDPPNVPEEQEAEQRPVETEAPVVFNGGISIEERAAAPKDGTILEFFSARGEYLSDVNVVVADSSGEEVVNTVTDGPWLILDLPEGQYNVQASFDGGSMQSGTIDVTGDPQKYGYMFPIQ